MIRRRWLGLAGCRRGFACGYCVGNDRRYDQASLFRSSQGLCTTMPDGPAEGGGRVWTRRQIGTCSCNCVRQARLAQSNCSCTCMPGDSSERASERHPTISSIILYHVCILRSTKGSSAISHLNKGRSPQSSKKPMPIRGYTRDGKWVTAWVTI